MARINNILSYSMGRWYASKNNTFLTLLDVRSCPVRSGQVMSCPVVFTHDHGVVLDGLDSVFAFVQPFLSYFLFAVVRLSTIPFLKSQQCHSIQVKSIQFRIDTRSSPCLKHNNKVNYTEVRRILPQVEVDMDIHPITRRNNQEKSKLPRNTMHGRNTVVHECIRRIIINNNSNINISSSFQTNVHPNPTLPPPVNTLRSSNRRESQNQTNNTTNKMDSISTTEERDEDIAVLTAAVI